MKKTYALFPALILTTVTPVFPNPQPSVAKAAEVILASAPEESLSYDLSFNWKFVWIKAGAARLVTRAVDYEGRPADETTLYASTSKKADGIFLLRDTLTAVLSRQREPLFYYKHCREGDGQVNEKVWFGRPAPGEFQVRQRKVYNDGSVKHTDTVCSRPVYDMVSLIQYARYSDFSKLRKGDRLGFLMAQSARVREQFLVYGGKEKLKVSGRSMECHIFSQVEPRTVKGRIVEEEQLRIYVQDDARRTPVEIDFLMKIGMAKARLVK